MTPFSSEDPRNASALHCRAKAELAAEGEALLRFAEDDAKSFELRF